MNIDDEMSTESGGYLLKKIMLSLQENNIPHCFLRNFEKLPYKWNGDVDILIPNRFRKQAVSLILKCADQVKAFPTSRRYYGTHDQVHLYLCNALLYERFLLIDIQTDLSHKGLIYMPCDAVINRTKLHSGFFIPVPGTFGAILLLHSIMDKRFFKSDYWKSIKDGAVQDRGRFLATLRDGVGEKFAEFMLQDVLAGKREHLLNYHHSIVAYICRYRPSSLIIVFHYFAKKVCAKVRNILWPPGVFAVLIGPDGSGKTTIAGKVIEVLRESPYPVSYIYLGGKNQTLPENLKTAFSIHRAVPKDTFLKKIRDFVAIVYHCFRYVVKYWKKIYPITVKGGIVVGDRYYFDLLSGSTYDLPCWLNQLIIRLMPNPQITILLANDVDTIRARKKELSLEEISRKLDRLRHLGRYVPGWNEVATSGTISEVVSTVLNKIMAKKQRNF